MLSAESARTLTALCASCVPAGNSVYPGHCSDPTCSQFGFLSDRSPTPMMAESLLYKLCMAGQVRSPDPPVEGA